MTLYTWERDVVNRNILGLNMDPQTDGGVGGGVRGLKQLVKTKKSYSCETNDKRTNQ